MKIARIYTGDNGESHFNDVEISFSDTEFIKGAQPIGLTEPWPAERVSIAKVPAGWSDSQHPTPARQLVVYLSGSAEMTTSDGETRIFKQADLVLLEDASGMGHGTSFAGDEATSVLLIRLE